jgi:hypothetical protein
VEFIPGLRTIVRHEVQQDGADRLVLAHVLKILKVNNNCYYISLLMNLVYSSSVKICEQTPSSR